MRGVYTWLLSWMSRLFHKFGIHCATHQIRLILISGLVITSLFYPAIGIYSDSIKSYINYPPSSSFNSLFRLNPHTVVFSEKDLDDVWTCHKALRVLDDDVTRARCGNEGTIRMERVLLTTNNIYEDTGVINYETLRTALQFETALADALTAGHISCLRAPSGSCARLSPLGFWSHDNHALFTDGDLLQTINTAQNTSFYGLPLRPSTVFAGRESAEPSEARIDFASYLALTFFFHEEDCNSAEGHEAWKYALQNLATEYGALSLHQHEPSLVALEYNVDIKHHYPVSSMTVTLYLSYFIFFVYFSGSMRNMNSVHSRIGLCFTGIVEIIVSTITSLSVCALYGIRITLVPWGIFPIVIVFVGAENMFRLVSDVSKTSISLPVKERIGIGLGKAGTANTLKVVSYNTILGVIAFFSQGAIRQFCAFAIVVLVAHWFLIHTFFVAVLSIDIQRLELDDLIRQESSGAVPSYKPLASRPVEDPDSGVLKQVVSSAGKATRGRITRNFSLLLLLVITGALYYSTLPPETDMPPIAINRASVLRNKTESARLNNDVGARDIWRLLNPRNRVLVHVRVESPAILALDLRHDTQSHERRSVRTRHRVLRAAWWFSKYMVVPIGGTLFTLYGILLYLLKGTERLEIHRVDPDQEECSVAPMSRKPPLKVFPRAFSTDAALLASNTDGSVVASVSSEGEAFVWRLATQVQLCIDMSGVILQGSSGILSRVVPTCIALSSRGNHLAIGTSLGNIGVWAITGNSAHFQPQYTLPRNGNAIVQVEFHSANDAHKGNDRPISRSQEDLSTSLNLMLVYADGRIASLSPAKTTEVVPSHDEQVSKAFLKCFQGSGGPFACFCFNDGTVEIIGTCQKSEDDIRIVLTAGTPTDQIIDVDVCRARVGDVSRTFVAAASECGSISVWDGATETVVASFEDGVGPTNSLRLVRSPPKACLQCGEVPSCMMQLISSVGHVVSVERIALVQRCSCPVQSKVGVKNNNVVRDSPKGRRSRSGSFVSSSRDSDSRPRSRHVSMSSDTGPDISAFPVSGHGRHSRRHSERDSTRRASDITDPLTLPAADSLVSTIAPPNGNGKLAVPDTNSFVMPSSESLSTTSQKRFRSMRLLDVTCERGGWGIVDGKLFVLRRKPRNLDRPSRDSAQMRTSPDEYEHGLSMSTLDRWEIWMLDLFAKKHTPSSSSFAQLPTISLTSVRVPGGIPGRNSLRTIPRIPFTRLSPLYFRDYVCVAGFGNTICMFDFS